MIHKYIAISCFDKAIGVGLFENYRIGSNVGDNSYDN